MEPVGRKLLPRVQPAIVSEQQATAVPVEHNRNGSHTVHHAIANAKPVQWQAAPVEEHTGQKRKRHDTDKHLHRQPRTPQALPSVQHLLTAQRDAHTPPASHNGHARLLRTSDDAYIHEGIFRFRSPPPQRDFPTSIFKGPQPLGFAAIEPDLMAIFRRAWYLRQHIRLKQLQGETWLDHIFFNDCFGVENALYTWTSRYEPGMVQYSVSKLYHKCLWLFFNRSVQASQPSPAYAQVVEDGLHHVRAIENTLGNSSDRSILLLPLFLLGVSAFYNDQRKIIWEALDHLDPTLTDDSVNHAAKSLERIWGMMDEGHAAATWEWERYHAHEYCSVVRNRILVDFLMDPLAPLVQPSRPRSPEVQEFDTTILRSASISQQQQQPQPQRHSTPAVAPMEQQQQRPQRDVHAYTPPSRKHTPYRNCSITSVDVSNDIRPNGTMNGQPPRPSESVLSPKSHPAPQDASSSKPIPIPQQQQELKISPLRPNLQQTIHSNDSIQVLHRRHHKSKSSIPPCPSCGKELKNPSDAQKHQLQHSKPFRCHEANCTRAQGFATENDLQRHRKSVHGASPRTGNKVGYVCAACPEPTDGTSRKWWPRLDNFKAHVRRKHQERDEEDLITLSATANRPHDTSSADSLCYSSSTSTTLRWSEDQQNNHSRRTSTYEYPYAHSHSHSHSHSGEGGGDYDATLRDSPENEEPDDNSDEHYQQERDRHDRGEHYEEIGARNGRYSDRDGEEYEGGDARLYEQHTEADRGDYSEDKERSTASLYADAMDTGTVDENGKVPTTDMGKREVVAERV